MFISIVGSSGIGLVWGWLNANVAKSAHQPFRTYLAIAFASLAISIQVLWFSAWQGTISFWGAAIFGFLAHTTWRRELQKGCGAK